MAGFKQYQMMFQLNASMNSGFNAAFQGGVSAVSKLQGEINSLNKTQSDISSYQKQQQAIELTKMKLARYKEELTNLAAAEAESSREEAHLANDMLEKQAQIDNVQQKLKKQEDALGKTGEALQAAGVDTKNLTSEQERLAAESANVARQQMREAQKAQEMGDSFKEAMQGISAGLESIGAAKAVQALYNSMKDASEQAAAFETAMASVKRTVGGDDAFISSLGESFKDLSTRIPITAAELAGIASTAGQLGIAQKNVETFSTVMARLATTTDLTAENAATMLAQFANITGVSDYERLGATVAALGDSTATTASKVVEMSQGMAAAANIAGMSETDILAIAAAVGSLGIEASAGSTSMSQLITTLYKATETGDNLEEFASVAGMSAEQFKQAWGSDAVGAMNAFIQGLTNVEQNGKSAVVILDELGISNVRQTKAILGLASAGDLLSNTIAQANSAWSSNSALTEKAGIMYGTTEAKLAMLQNAANNVSIAVGDALNPALSGAAGALTGLLGHVADILEANPALVQGITAFAGALGVTVTGITAYTAATKLAAAASKLFAGSFPAMGGILAVAGGIGALVTIISSIVNANKEAGKSFEELQAEYIDLQDSLEQNQHVLNLVDQYTRLSDEVKLIQNLEPGDIELKAKIEASGLTEENIHLIDELKARIENESGEIKQILSIAGVEDVTAENLKAITDLADATADGEHDLKQQLEIIGAKDITNEDIQKIKDLAANAKDDEHVLKQTLTLLGIDDISDENLQKLQKFANEATDGDHQLKQQLELLGAENLTDEDIRRIGELSSKATDGNHTLKQTIAMLGIEDITDENLQKLKDLANNSADGNHALKQQLSLLGVDSITDENLKKLTDLSAKASDGEHKLAQWLTMLGADNITNENLQKITDLATAATDGEHELKQQLTLLGANQISDSDMARLKELADAVITKSGTISETLELSGFENYEAMKAASELPISSKTAKIMVDLQANGYTDLQEKLKTIGAQVLSAKDAVDQAESQLTTMQGQAQAIQSAIDLTKKWETKKKKNLEDDLAGVNEQIEAQEQKVSSLKEAHGDLVQEYEAVSAAAAELKSREDELNATKAALAGTIDGITTATEEETEALLAQARAAEEVNKALLMNDIYSNLAAQARTYSAAVNDAEKAEAQQQYMMERMQVAAKYQGKGIDDINAAYQNLLLTLDQMEAQEGWTPDSADYQAAAKEAEHLASIFNGMDMSILEDASRLSGGWVDWLNSYGDLSITEENWNEALASMSKALVDFNGEVDSSTAKQAAFLDLLVNGVTSGAVGIEEIKTRLSAAFAEEENGEALLAQAMEYVTQRVNEYEEAAQSAAEGQAALAQATEELSNATEIQGRSVDSIISDIEALNKAYESAYKSAYESMTGQFNLFEKVKQVSGKAGNVNGGQNSYVKGLQSQTEYITKYTEDYEKAAAALQAAETALYGEGASHDTSSTLLSQLADGSAESAQILADLAAAAPGDVQTLISEYEKSKAAADEFAQKVADTETNFNATMEQLKQEISEAAQAMDFSGEASANASASLEAFISAASSYVGRAHQAYKKVADAAAAGLRFNPTYLPGHAAGTNSAQRGLALVGERGPEIVEFRGGEKVLNANDTARALGLNATPIQAQAVGAGYGKSTGTRNYNVNVSIPSINASGVDAYELQQIVVETLGENLEKELRNMEEDHRRRSYA